MLLALIFGNVTSCPSGAYFWGRMKHKQGFSGGASGKEPPANAVDVRDAVSILGSGRSPGVRHRNPLYILAWRIPCLEEPGGLQFIGSQNVRYD